MIRTNDFAGKNEYVWFMGVVEGRDDPAKLGRVRVRVIGWHDEDRISLPTEDLPWAQILLPTNNSRTISLPKEGEWVHGFFMDGNAGQQPIITGVVPGVLSEKPKVATTGSSNLAVLEAQLAAETKKLDVMTSSTNVSLRTQKYNSLKTKLDIIDVNLASATIIKNRVQAQYDSASSYAKASIVENLLRQEKIVSDLQTQKNNIVAEMNQYVPTSVSQIETQKKVVKNLQKQVNTLKSNLTESNNRGFVDVRTQEQVDAGPKPIEGVVLEEQNKPSIPALGRGNKENTGISVSDQNLIHVCDIVAEMDLGIASLKSKVSGLISTIRIAIESLFDGLSLNPSSEGITQQAKMIKAKLDTLRKELKKITDEIAAVKAYIKYLQDLIDYINKLPAELQKLYAECLSQATKDLTSYTDTLKTLESATTTAKTDAINQVTTALQVTENTTAVESNLGTLA